MKTIYLFLTVLYSFQIYSQDIDLEGMGYNDSYLETPLIEIRGSNNLNSIDQDSILSKSLKSTSNKSLYFFKDGTTSYKLNSNKILHKSDGPAEITKNGSERWFFEGKLHRDLKPAVTDYDNKLKIISKEWYKRGKKHSYKDQPAVIHYHDNGKLYQKLWYKEDQLHRDSDKPAIITYNPKGDMVEKQWYQYGMKHRENNKYAKIIYTNKSDILSKYWFVNDQLHREGGPASIYYDSHGVPVSMDWYLLNENVFATSKNKFGHLITFQRKMVLENKLVASGLFSSLKFFKTNLELSSSLNQTFAKNNPNFCHYKYSVSFTDENNSDPNKMLEKEFQKKCEYLNSKLLKSVIESS